MYYPCIHFFHFFILFVYHFKKIGNYTDDFIFQRNKNEKNYFDVKESLKESLVQNTSIIYENNLIIYEKVANTRKKF
jgi:hypothetical protein